MLSHIHSYNKESSHNILRKTKTKLEQQYKKLAQSILITSIMNNEASYKIVYELNICFGFPIHILDGNRRKNILKKISGKMRKDH
jgi:hypothetical protein